MIPFEVDATNSVTPGSNTVIDYDLQPYENFCRPNNPLCISGSTCADCNYNYNGHTEPHYTIQGQLILYTPNPNAHVTVLNSERGTGEATRYQGIDLFLFQVAWSEFHAEFESLEKIETFTKDAKESLDLFRTQEVWGSAAPVHLPDGLA